jgi:hypothetical protein
MYGMHNNVSKDPAHKQALHDTTSISWLLQKVSALTAGGGSEKPSDWLRELVWAERVSRRRGICWEGLLGTPYDGLSVRIYEHDILSKSLTSR